MEQQPFGGVDLLEMLSRLTGLASTALELVVVVAAFVAFTRLRGGTVVLAAGLAVQWVLGLVWLATDLLDVRLFALKGLWVFLLVCGLVAQLAVLAGVAVLPNRRASDER